MSVEANGGGAAALQALQARCVSMPLFLSCASLSISAPLCLPH